MRKFTKILIRVLSACLLLPILVSLLAMLALTIPSVQNYVVDRAAGYASEKTGSTVSIDRISLGFLDRVKIRGFFVADADGDTLIYAKVLKVTLGTISDFKGGIRIPAAYLENGKCIIRETDRGVMNIKEIVDRISKHKGKGRFRLVISDLKADSLDFCLKRIKKRNPAYGVDYSDMHLNGIKTSISDFTVKGSGVGGDISSISFVERSGFRLDRMSTSFWVDKGLIDLKNLSLETGRTSLSMPSMTLSGDGWASYKNFTENVVLTGRAEHSRVSSSDIAFFAPSLKKWDLEMSDVNLDVEGTVCRMKASLSSPDFGNDGAISVTAKANGLPKVKNSRFDVCVKNLDIPTRELERILGNIANLEIPQNAEKYLDRIERVKLSGKFNGTTRLFTASTQASLSSGGNLIASFAMDGTTERKMINASADMAGINLRTLLASPSFGDGSMSLSADGVLTEETKDINFSGEIFSLSFLRHNYNYADFSGKLEGQKVTANVSVDDEALKCDMKAFVSLPKSGNPSYRISGDIAKADLHALNINRRDSVSLLSARLNADVRGRSIDELCGDADILNAKYTCPSTELSTDGVYIDMDVDRNTHRITLESEFADADIRSTGHLSEAASYVGGILRRYIPSLFIKGPDDMIPSTGRTAVKFCAKNMEPLLQCISDNADIAPGTYVNLNVNPKENDFRLHASSQCINYGSVLVTELDVDASNESDSLSLRAKTSDLYLGMLRTSVAGVECGAKNNLIELKGEYSDSVSGAFGMIAARAMASKIDGARHVSLRLLPSGLSGSDNVWHITADGIEMDSSRIDVKNFNVRNRYQHLYVNGTASHQEQDSIVVKLSNFSFAPFLGVTKKMGYTVNGYGTGDIKVRSALKKGRVEALIHLDSVDVNGISVPDLRLTSKWDFEHSRASLNVLTEEKNDTVIRGFYSPQKVRYFAESRLDGINMRLLDPVLKGVVKNTTGRAVADLKLYGERRNADLSGSIDIDSLSTMLDFTKCRYSIPKAVISVHNNRFHVDPVPMYDESGNSGSFEMDLSLNHLSNIEYRLDTKFRNMKVLSTTLADNSLFYGNMFASGTARVNGDKSGTKLDITATSSDGSQFFMPLADRSSISNAEFLRFESASSVDTTSYLIRKKMMFERKQKSASESSGDMNISMSLDIRPNTEIQLVVDPTVGDILKARGSGLLNMQINPKKSVFDMYGDYTISEGSYLFTLQKIVNKRFLISKGSTIQWTGEPLDAILNIEAIYKVKTSLQPLLSGYVSNDNVSSRSVPVNCCLYLTDRLSHPTVDFGVEVPNSDASTQSIISTVLSTPEDKAKQFLYLLVANSFIADASTFESVGGASAANTGLEMLSNQFSNWLSTDDYNVVLRYRSKTERMMSDQLDFGISKGLVNNRLLIELEGNYLVDKSQVENAKSNFSGEAYVTWLIDKAGALRLKGFTQPIDRFDENQGLQETGLGIYYKEDFDNARDFRNRVKHRFGRKYRKTKKKGNEKSKQ